MEYRASKAWHFSHNLALEVHELVREVVPNDKLAMLLALKLRKASATAPLQLERSARVDLNKEKLACYKTAQHAIKQVYTHLTSARKLDYINEQLFDKLINLAIVAHDELDSVIESTEKTRDKEIYGT